MDSLNILIATQDHSKLRRCIIQARAHRERSARSCHLQREDIERKRSRASARAEKENRVRARRARRVLEREGRKEGAAIRILSQHA